MTKQIKHELTYDASVEEVAAMLGDRAFREEVCEAQGGTRTQVSIDVDGEAKKVVIDFWQPTRGMPGFAKKIAGEETNVVQTEDWASPSRADIEVRIPGKPGDIRGTAVLEPRDGGTVETVELTVKVSIPLVGGKLEGLIAELMLKALKAENSVGRTYLAR